MVSLAPSLDKLLKSVPSSPDKTLLDSLVKDTLNESAGKSSPENRKSQWEFLLKNQVFLLAVNEGAALEDEETKYYDQLRDILDLVLTFTEHEATEQTFPFVVLQDLLETQTIASCSHIFSWIESRATLLTKDMIPQKGKALILLRTLNDLLRRLSKMGSTTIFCGRILTFLSGVFPLGERSGVNLRGEYGPKWEAVGASEVEKTEQPDVDKMEVDSAETRKPSSDEIYNTFWSLQLPFSFPPALATQNTFSEFQAAVNIVLPIIKEATTKERAMMGSRALTTAAQSQTLKRKREEGQDEDETSTDDYFFAKFLTSPELLDLEIADTHFRRQVLFQLLILLHHLLTFTPTTFPTWSTTRNRSLHMSFTLSAADEKWVQETISKSMEELRQTMPGGRAFAETVAVILERERNWVRWKNGMCAPFDKEPWVGECDVEIEENGQKMTVKKSGFSMEEATRESRKRMRSEPKDWEHRLGSAALSDIWDMGYRSLEDLQNPFQAGDIKDFVKKVRLDDGRIELRKKQLARLAKPKVVPKPIVPSPPSHDAMSVDVPVPTPAPFASSPLLHPSLPAKPGTPIEPLSVAPVIPPVVVPETVPAAVAPTPPEPTDPQIAKFEENKQKWSWLALRTGRDQYLQHFGKIGTGDIMQLATEIEKEKEALAKQNAISDAAQKQQKPLIDAAGAPMEVSSGAEVPG